MKRVKQNPDFWPRCYSAKEVKRVRLKEQEIEDIKRHYFAGANIEQTCRAFERSRATINKALNTVRYPA